MPKAKDIDIKKVSVTKQEFEFALKKACRKIDGKKAK